MHSTYVKSKLLTEVIITTHLKKNNFEYHFIYDLNIKIDL